jgi:hypothetical protein
MSVCYTCTVSPRKHQYTNTYAVSFKRQASENKLWVLIDAGIDRMAMI